MNVRAILHIWNAMNQTTPQDLNLMAHRTAGASVWDRRGWDGTRELALARWLVGIGGAVLLVEGWHRRGATRSFLAGFGGSLIWWALTGQGDVSTAGKWVADVLEHVGHSADPVQEASADSFPASDATSFTPMVGTGLRSGRLSAH
jgi:hypothetical protein